MKVVVDANRVISAVIRSARTREALLFSEAELFAPTFLREELDRHKEMLLTRSAATSAADLDAAIDVLTARIRWVTPEEILPFDDAAHDALGRVDEKDVPYLACALAVRADAI